MNYLVITNNDYTYNLKEKDNKSKRIFYTFIDQS